MLQILTIHEAIRDTTCSWSTPTASPLDPPRAGLRRVHRRLAVYTEQMMLDQATATATGPAPDAAEVLPARRGQRDARPQAALREMTTKRPWNSSPDGLSIRGEARLKIIRAKQTSCQLSTYFVGRMALYRTRQLIARELAGNSNWTVTTKPCSAWRRPVKY